MRPDKSRLLLATKFVEIFMSLIFQGDIKLLLQIKNMLRNIFAIVITSSFLLLSCNQNKQTETTKNQNTDIQTEDFAVSENLLEGSWVQPNPINAAETQGFNLFMDSTATSINMATLVYKKWWEENGQLVLVSESIGNRTSSTDTTKFEIVENTITELVIKNKGVTEKFRRQ